MAMTSTLQAEPPGMERHPEIHEAIHALENAKAHLLEARHDFGGHRDAAIHACDEAINQLKAAIEFDNRH
jgi:hypothetical protein